MSEWWIVLQATLAAYFITWVVVESEIASPFVDPLRLRFERRWIRKHAGDDENLAHLYGKSEKWNSKLAYLLSCIPCLGFWVSGVVTVILSVAYGLDYPILTWLAMSAVVGFLGRIDSE